jgi:hypothetical protein
LRRWIGGDCEHDRRKEKALAGRDVDKRRKEVRTAAPAGWTLPCARPLDAAPRGRAAQATLASCVVSVCSNANDRKMSVHVLERRKQQAAKISTLFTLLSFTSVHAWGYQIPIDRALMCRVLLMCRVQTSIIYIVCYIHGIYPAKDEDRELSCNNFFFICVWRSFWCSLSVFYQGLPVWGSVRCRRSCFFSSGIYS